MSPWLLCPDCREGQLPDGRACPTCGGCAALSADPQPRAAIDAHEYFKTRVVPPPQCALTLRPHWAHAVTDLGKWVENRASMAPVRLLGKRIAIHAGARDGRDPAQDAREAASLGLNPAHCAASAIVATARVFAFVRHEGKVIEVCDDPLEVESPDDLGRVVAELHARAERATTSPWWRGPIGWCLDQVIKLNHPVRCTGNQGPWRMPVQTLFAVRVAENRTLGRFGVGLRADSPAPVQP